MFYIINPVYDELIIKGEIKEMILYNVLGERIRLKTTDKLIDLTNLNTGIYLLRVKTSNETITKKIVKN